IKATMKLMTWTKIKTAAITIAAVAFTAGVATVAISAGTPKSGWSDLKDKLAAAHSPLPSVLIAPSSFSFSTSLAKDNDHLIGIGISLKSIINISCGVHPNNMGRAVFPENLPSGSFDFIAETSDARAALKAKLQQDFRVTVKTETIETNVWLLT